MGSAKEIDFELLFKQRLKNLQRINKKEEDKVDYKAVKKGFHSKK